jgi:hypothetical protein
MEKALISQYFENGTTLAKPHNVKLRITYREYSILAGIVVAAIILIILWLQPLATEVSVNTSEGSPGLLQTINGLMVQKMQTIVQLLR